MKSIMLSGPDGTGKSTISLKLKEYYKKQDYNVISIWLRFHHYFAKIVNFIGRILGKSFYENYSWGKVGYHNYTGVIGYFYILAVLIDHILFIIFKKPFVLKKQKDRFYIIDRYILDVVADLIVDTGKSALVFKFFNRFVKAELKKVNSFILECPKEIVISRRSDIADDKKYSDKISAYKEIALKYGIKTINTGILSVDEVVKKIVE